MKKIWLARIILKTRNRLTDDDFDTVEADTPEQLLRKLLRFRHSSWVEIERIELIRKADAIKKGIPVESTY